MKYSFYTLSIFLFSIVNAFAEEAAHHEPSVMDLKYPFINFVVLVGFIVYKAKKPLSEMFTKKAEDVKSLMESAEKQSKDANQKLQELESKIKNIDSELVKISSDYDKDAATFAKMQGEETETTIARMKRDIEGKLSGEKNELVEQLSHEMLDLVIKNTQNTIGSNKDLKNKATTNIIAGMK